MDHNYIQNNDIIDKYLLHQLTEEEESELEEHLLFCDECLNALEKRKAIIGIIRNKLPDEINRQKLTDSEKIKKPKNKFTFFLKIAASIIFLVSLAWLGNLLLDENETGKRIVSLETLNDDSITGRNVDSTVEHKIIDNNYTENKIQLAEAYKTLPEFENYIKNPVRSEDLKVLSPALNKRFGQNEAISLNWKSPVYDSLSFIVFDNKAKVIFEKRIDSNYIFKQKLTSGLYYWQLETPEEALFTGKFTVQK